MSRLIFGFLATIAVTTGVAHAKATTEADGPEGIVVIGVKADFTPEFTWRPFDPSTGKLRPFKVVKNVADEAQKKLSGLFSTIGRFGGRDKRYVSNEAGISYRFAKLAPGSYVLETVAVPGRWTAFDGQVPIVQIVSGKASYVGDFLIERDKSGARATAIGSSLNGARTFLAAFPKESSILVEEEIGNATLDCRGKLVAFASQIVCDTEQSLVKEVRFR